VRWPGIAPTTMKAAFFRLVVALVLLQVGATVLGVVSTWPRRWGRCSWLRRSYPF